MTLESANDGVKLAISDNGIGFDPDEKLRGYDGRSGLGLRSMRERVEATGGTFALNSAPDKKGVEVRAFWAAEDLDPSQ